MASERGCGYRKKGGMYLETRGGPNGIPFDEFLIDPPFPVDDWELPDIGMSLRERDGVYHVIDVVGGAAYPNVADFIEEARRCLNGAFISRKIAPHLVAKLTPGASKIFLAHRRAYIENWQDWVFDPHIESNLKCPKRLPYHTWSKMIGVWSEDEGASVGDDDYPPCLGITWNDIEGGETIPDLDDQWRVVRHMPSFDYTGHSRVEGVTTVYKTALFLSLPITNIVAIADGGDEQKAIARAGGKFDVEVVEE